jgi:hypothetical protein
MKRKYLFWPGMLVLLGTTMIGTAVARELTEEEVTVVCKLEEVVEEAGRDGYDLAYWPVVRKGPANVNAPLTLRLDPSIEYIFVGYCDENCDDTELQISTLAGEMLESDEEETVSVLPFEPAEEGIYELNLQMTSCTLEDGCVYGIGILAPREVDVPYSPDVPKELAQFEVCD